MAAFSKNSSELPESQIEYREEGGARRWVSLIVYIVLALVVATLVVFAARWLYHKVSNNSEPAQTTISTESTQQGTKNNPNPASPTPSTGTNPPSNSSTSNNGNKSTATPPSSSGNKSTTPSPTPSSLPNNGPGEVIAAFIGATLLGYGFDSYMTKRRHQKMVSGQ